jgi:hypothetical protein
VIRKALLLAALLVAMGFNATLSGPASAAEQPAAPPQVTAEQAAPFLGDWTLALQGPNGPGTFTLSIRAEKETVVAEIGSENGPSNKITTITKTEKGLVFSYTFPYEGNPIDALVSLTPDTDGKTAAQIDFAGGAYTMTGTATKKEKVK